MFGGELTTWKNANAEKYFQFIDTITDKFETETYNELLELNDKINDVNKRAVVLNKMTLPNEYKEFENVFKLWKTALIEQSNSIKFCDDAFEMVSFVSDGLDGLKAPILEALCAYEIECNKPNSRFHPIISIEKLGGGDFSYVFKVKDSLNNEFVLKIDKVIYNKTPKYHMFEKVMNARFQNFPEIYFGSWNIEHYLPTPENEKIDCSWMYMKLYEGINLHNPPNEYKNKLTKIVMTMLKLSCDFYEKEFVFDDWKIDNMVYDKEKDEYVICDTDLLYFGDDGLKAERLYFTNSVHNSVRYYLGKYIGGEGIYEKRFDGINSFHIMIFTIKRMLYDIFANRKELMQMSVNDLFNCEEVRNRLSDELKEFVDLVQLPRAEFKVFDVVDVRDICNRYVERGNILHH